MTTPSHRPRRSTTETVCGEPNSVRGASVVTDVLARCRSDCDALDSRTVTVCSRSRLRNAALRRDAGRAHRHRAGRAGEGEREERCCGEERGEPPHSSCIGCRAPLGPHQDEGYRRVRVRSNANAADPCFASSGARGGACRLLRARPLALSTTSPAVSAAVPAVVAHRVACQRRRLSRRVAGGVRDLAGRVTAVAALAWLASAQNLV